MSMTRNALRWQFAAAQTLNATGERLSGLKPTSRLLREHLAATADEACRLIESDPAEPPPA